MDTRWTAPLQAGGAAGTAVDRRGRRTNPKGIRTYFRGFGWRPGDESTVAARPCRLLGHAHGACPRAGGAAGTAVDRGGRRTNPKGIRTYFRGFGWRPGDVSTVAARPCRLLG